MIQVEPSSSHEAFPLEAFELEPLPSREEGQEELPSVQFQLSEDSFSKNDQCSRKRLHLRTPETCLQSTVGSITQVGVSI